MRWSVMGIMVLFLHSLSSGAASGQSTLPKGLQVWHTGRPAPAMPAGGDAGGQQ